MIGITWVEALLFGLFAGTLAFSIGFCVNNYARSEARKLVEKTAKSQD